MGEEFIIREFELSFFWASKNCDLFVFAWCLYLIYKIATFMA